MIINTTLGMDEVRSSKSILRMPSIINTPIMIRIGEVADTGTIPAMGAKNIAKINSDRINELVYLEELINIYNQSKEREKSLRLPFFAPLR